MGAYDLDAGAARNAAARRHLGRRGQFGLVFGDEVQRVGGGAQHKAGAQRARKQGKTKLTSSVFVHYHFSENYVSEQSRHRSESQRSTTARSMMPQPAPPVIGNIHIPAVTKGRPRAGSAGYNRTRLSRCINSGSSM